MAAIAEAAARRLPGRSTVRAQSPGISQLTTSIKNIAGADRERRRFSIIFQRASAEMLRQYRPQIQGSSCQSPRTQRCERMSATPVCDGNSSNSSTSLTNPQRAKVPSRRS